MTRHVAYHFEKMEHNPIDNDVPPNIGGQSSLAQKRWHACPGSYTRHLDVGEVERRAAEGRRGVESDDDENKGRAAAQALEKGEEEWEEGCEGGGSRLVR